MPCLDRTGHGPVLLFLGQKAGAGEKSGVDFAGNEVGMGQDFLVQRDGGIDSFHHEHVQGPAHACHGFVAVCAIGDQFGYQAES